MFLWKFPFRTSCLAFCAPFLRGYFFDTDGSVEDNFKPESEDEETSDEDEDDGGGDEESEEMESDSDSVITSPVKVRVGSTVQITFKRRKQIGRNIV